MEEQFIEKLKGYFEKELKNGLSFKKEGNRFRFYYQKTACTNYVHGTHDSPPECDTEIVDDDCLVFVPEIPEDFDWVFYLATDKIEYIIKSVNERVEELENPDEYNKYDNRDKE